MALNIVEKDNKIAVFNRTSELTKEFHEQVGSLTDQVVPCEPIAEFVTAVRSPRSIIIMINAVDGQMALLQSHLSKGDIMIDAGNANFRDTMRRFNALEK